MRAPDTVRRPAAGGRPPRHGLLLGMLAALLTLTLLGPMMTIVGSASLTGEGSLVRQGAYLATFALVIYAVRPLEGKERLLAMPLPLVGALAWCWLSVTWAIEPGIAVRRVVLTSVIMWSIFAVVKQLGYERTILLVRAALLAALIANYVAVLLFPAIGMHQADELHDKALTGDWRGIMAQKNIAGAVTALTLLVFAFDAGKMPIAVRVGIVAAAALFLAKCESRTSAGICILVVSMGLIYLRYNARYRLLVLGGTVTLTIALAIFLNIYNDPLLRHLDDPTALTGRAEIWQVLLKYAGDHPLFGAGYGSFWNIGAASPIYQYANSWVVQVAQGHNGFLDLLVQIGLPGLLIVIAAAIVWPLARLFASRTVQGARGALIVAMFLFCVGHNGTESSLFDRDAIGQVFLMIALALLWTVTAAPVSGSIGTPARRMKLHPTGAPHG